MKLHEIIRTRRIAGRFYLCGDGVSDVGAGEVLFAPRVALCAAQQALLALRIVLGIEDAPASSTAET